MVDGAAELGRCTAHAETDARAAFLYTPMDDLMRDAFGPPDSAEELTPDEWAMPSLVPPPDLSAFRTKKGTKGLLKHLTAAEVASLFLPEMHDDEWVSLSSDDEWVMVPSPRRSRSAAAATTERADLASSMLQLENIQHRLDALQLEIYWYCADLMRPLAKTASEELQEQFIAGGEEYDRHEAARFHRWVENARRAHLRRARSGSV